MVSFEAGIGIQDITPEPGAPLWGYAGRPTGATGTLDPLHAKAVVFRAGRDCVAVVTADLGRVPDGATCARIRAAAQDLGVNGVFLSATHTHHAPAMEGGGQPYHHTIERGIISAIGAALADLAPAHIGLGSAEIDIAHNRCVIGADGRCRMLWRNATRVPTTPVDREATIIRLDDDQGRLRAVLVHFACHPVVMGPSNLEYSADYVGELCRRVERECGAPCVFIQGACGDLNPYLDKTPIESGGVAAMRDTGRLAAHAVASAVPGIATAPPAQPGVACGEVAVHAGLRWDLENPEQRAVFLEGAALSDEQFGHYREELVPGLTLTVSVLVLNGTLALVGFPGEAFVQQQISLKRAAPAPTALLCGYVNGYSAYLPPIRNALAGGYGGTVRAYVGLGAPERMLLEAQLEIARLQNRLHPHCTPDDFVIESLDP